MATITLDRPDTVAAVTRRADLTLRYLTLAASVMSVLAYAWFFHHGQTLEYEDSVSHLEIARRLINSPTTGLGQLGSVWLPLPHLLMIPFVWYKPFYFNGFAGSVVSMAAYVITSTLLYKIVFSLTGRKTAAVVGALVFMTNPNVLYMQSTPMTELLLFMFLAAMVYGVQRWIQTDRPIPYLVGAGLAAAFGTLTRYEAWVLFAALGLIVMVAAWRKGYAYRRLEDIVLSFGIIGGIGVFLWLGWNQAIFGNLLEWQDGQYAKPSLWVNRDEPSIGHWFFSLKVYTYAMTDDLLWPVMLAMIVGAIALAVRGRFKLETLPVFSLFVMVPFFVYSLESGQRPLHVMQLNGALYNVRFGLLMILPAAVCAGYLVSLVTRPLLIKGVCVLSGVVMAYAVAQIPTNRTITVIEPQAFDKARVNVEFTAAGAFLRGHYHGGIILAQFFGNEGVLFKAGITPGSNIYEGSYHKWSGPNGALAIPAAYHVQWIIMRSGDSTDQVYVALHASPLLTPYRLVYNQVGYRIYELAVDAPPVVTSALVRPVVRASPRPRTAVAATVARPSPTPLLPVITPRVLTALPRPTKGN